MVKLIAASLPSVALTVTLITLLFSSAAQGSDPAPIVLKGAAVLDQDFQTVVADQTIVIVDGRILEVGPVGQALIPEGAQVIEVKGKTVIPGLWDAHVHTRYEGIDHLRLLIVHGIAQAGDPVEATLTPAEMMGVSDQGLIKAGYVADLLVLDADPLADIGNTRAIAMVVSQGRVLNRQVLDAMIKDITAKAASWSGQPSGR